MAIDVEQLKTEIIEPTLKDAGVYSPEATQLLLGTAATESALGTYVRQIGGGPAQGIFQMEPDTEEDIWRHFLSHPKRKELREYAAKLSQGELAPLTTNLAYQTLMARLHYLRVSEPLPPLDDIPAQAQYWKKYYNTVFGKGTEADYIEKHYRFIGE